MTAPTRVHRYSVVAAFLALAIHGLHAQTPPSQDRVPVIVGFRQPPGPNEQALVRSFGATIRQTYWLVPAIAAEVPQAALQAMRNNPTFTNVDLDVPVYEVDGELDAAWGVKRIGSGLVHDAGNKGGGVRVCVIDSGVDYTHPDLSLNYLGGHDFVNGDDDPFDDRGHGSHVTGSLLAVDNNAGVVGVAPEATVLAYKILDQNGQGFISNSIAALQACITAGGQVTNSSFGTQSDPGSTVKAAYDNAEALGLVNVAAAGNRTSLFTCTSIAFPARYGSVIAVTATDANNKIASTSCRGAEAELAAPGVSIFSTVPTGICTYCTSSGYNTLSGTSMASPHVAGVAALVIATGIVDSNNNGRINDEVRERLQVTADDLGTAGRDANYGYGLVDADEAAPPTPPDPPLPPSALGATAASSSRIDLLWTDNSNNEAGFKIERCTGSAPCSGFTQIATVGAGVTSYASIGLTASTTYTHRVRAHNGGGNSDYSNEAHATTSGETSPAAPTNLSASAASSSQINLSWTDNSFNETGFEIQRCQAATCADEAFSAIATVGAGTTSYSNTGLAAGTTYTYRVAAQNGSGSSAYSNPASATTQAAASLTLSVRAYKVGGLQKADLTWSGATSANVNIVRNGVTIITTANDGFHTDNINARGGGSYTYKVCEAGTPTCSNEVVVIF